MKLAYGAGCVDIEVEVEDVGKTFRIMQPGWNETMEDFEVEALETLPGPSTFTVGDNALLPVSGQQGQPEPETRVASRDAILKALEAPEVDPAEPPAPFWVKPNLETWEFLAQDLVKDAQDGIVDIVAESCLHGMVIRGWQGEAWGRLHVNLAKAMKEVMA